MHESFLTDAAKREGQEFADATRERMEQEPGLSAFLAQLQTRQHRSYGSLATSLDLMATPFSSQRW